MLLMWTQNGGVMPTRKQRIGLEFLAAKPDAEIDQSDIPEITDERWAGAIRGVFARSATVLKENSK